MKTPKRSRCSTCRKLKPVAELAHAWDRGICAACRLAAETCSASLNRGSRERYCTAKADRYTEASGYICAEHFEEFYAVCEGCGKAHGQDEFCDPKGRGLCDDCAREEDGPRSRGECSVKNPLGNERPNMRVTIAPESLEVFEGPLVEEDTEDGPIIVCFKFVGIEINGKLFEHPHGFRQHAEAEDFRASIALKGNIDLSKWVEIEEGPSLEERLGPGGIEWEREQEDRMFGGW